MMRSMMSALLVLGMGTGAALAQKPAAAPKAETKKEAKSAVTKFAGAVESVDAAASKLTVKNKKGEAKEFAIGAEVKISKGGKKAALSDIAAGDQVTIASEGDQVKSVKVHPAKAAKKK